jgi:hypothetical protein
MSLATRRKLAAILTLDRRTDQRAIEEVREFGIDNAARFPRDARPGPLSGPLSVRPSTSPAVGLTNRLQPASTQATCYLALHHVNTYGLTCDRFSWPTPGECFGDLFRAHAQRLRLNSREPGLLRLEYARANFETEHG